MEISSVPQTVRGINGIGMMDNPIYCNKMLSKLQFYISNGIIPTIQLITTYETKETPLSAETVEKIVEEYFLL